MGGAGGLAGYVGVWVERDKSDGVYVGVSGCVRRQGRQCRDSRITATRRGSWEAVLPPPPHPTLHRPADVSTRGGVLPAPDSHLTD